MKENLKPLALMYPAPAAVAAAYDNGGNVDACTLAFAAMCSHHPPCIMIAINSTAKRKTLVSILDKKEFSLAFPSTEHACEADYLGMISGYDSDKIDAINFTVTDASQVDAPIIDEFKVSLECRVLHTCDIGSHTQIIAEIVNVQADSDILNDKGKIDFDLLDPIAYDIFNRQYYSLGEKIGKSYTIGSKYI